eukprot:GHVT01090048.1.p1 GENE.GHVT01090048.1~~GHVT01090048.1.p1  ORF type:complete len:629 (+),score=118.60 GHVT01090048.1:1083-2969(+)
MDVGAGPEAATARYFRQHHDAALSYLATAQRALPAAVRLASLDQSEHQDRPTQAGNGQGLRATTGGPGGEAGAQAPGRARTAGGVAAAHPPSSGLVSGDEIKGVGRDSKLATGRNGRNDHHPGTTQVCRSIEVSSAPSDAYGYAENKIRPGCASEDTGHEARRASSFTPGNQTYAPGVRTAEPGAAGFPEAVAAWRSNHFWVNEDHDGGRQGVCMLAEVTDVSFDGQNVSRWGAWPVRAAPPSRLPPGRALGPSNLPSLAEEGGAGPPRGGGGASTDQFQARETSRECRQKLRDGEDALAPADWVRAGDRRAAEFEDKASEDSRRQGRRGPPGEHTPAPEAVVRRSVSGRAGEEGGGLRTHTGESVLCRYLSRDSACSGSRVQAPTNAAACLQLCEREIKECVRLVPHSTEAQRLLADLKRMRGAAAAAGEELSNAPAAPDGTGRVGWTHGLHARAQLVKRFVLAFNLGLRYWDAGKGELASKQMKLVLHLLQTNHLPLGCAAHTLSLMKILSDRHAEAERSLSSTSAEAAYALAHLFFDKRMLRAVNEALLSAKGTLALRQKAQRLAAWQPLKTNAHMDEGDFSFEALQRERDNVSSWMVRIDDDIRFAQKLEKSEVQHVVALSASG